MWKTALSLACAVCLVAACGGSDSTPVGAGGQNPGSSGTAGRGGSSSAATAGSGQAGTTDPGAGASGEGGAAAGGGDNGSAGSTAGAGRGGTTSSGGSSSGAAGAAGAPGEGGAGITLPACPGPTERCDSARCTGDAPCRTCPAGKRCVEVELTCGPASGVVAHCVDDPCAGEALSCECAGALCDEIGAPSCAVYDQDHFLVGPNRAPFFTCAGGTP